MPDDELNQEQNPEEDELEQTVARVAELDGLVAQREEELTKANTCITGLEQAVNQAVTSYRVLAVQANPDVIEELITGDTIDDIDGSLKKAKTFVSRVREGFEAEMAGAKVPAGAPQRTPIDLSVLSPREKIQYAI